MWPAFTKFVNQLMFSQPPSRAAYGFRWRAGQGVPNELTFFDVQTGVGSGIYVCFDPTALATTTDPFARFGPGPVFAAPNVPSTGLIELINNVREKPPPNESDLFDDVTQERLCDLTGFLSYTNTCLEIINQTAAGAQLLTTINAAQHSVYITPSTGGNQTAAGDPSSQNTLVEAILNYVSGQPMPIPQILAIVDQKYAAINNRLGRFNQLATDLNHLPLCSLFEPAGTTANFLLVHFPFHGQQFTGQNLMDWLSPNGFPAFDQNLRTLNTVFQGISIRQAFLLAMNIVLYSAVPPGPGTGSGIRFNVRNVSNNDLNSPDFRPPAIGLAHELMHAMHYGRGTASGPEFGNFLTTAAELLFSGIGPFANEPITENVVRGQWGTIPGHFIDASNTWANPALRTIYDRPAANQTAKDLRDLSFCI